MTAEAFDYNKTIVITCKLGSLTAKQVLAEYKEAARAKYGNYAADKGSYHYRAGTYTCRIGEIGNVLRTEHPEVVLAGAELLRSGRLDIGGTRPPPLVEVKYRRGDVQT